MESSEVEDGTRTACLRSQSLTRLQGFNLLLPRHF